MNLFGGFTAQSYLSAPCLNSVFSVHPISVQVNSLGGLLPSPIQAVLA